MKTFKKLVTIDPNLTNVLIKGVAKTSVILLSDFSNLNKSVDKFYIEAIGVESKLKVGNRVLLDPMLFETNTVRSIKSDILYDKETIKEMESEGIFEIYFFVELYSIKGTVKEND